MHSDLKNLLKRLESLEKGEGLRRARVWARVLSFVGLALCVLVLAGITFGLHPIAVAAAAAAMGWVIAESNALRTRLAQWPLFRRYIDWKLVEEDLTGNPQ